MTMAPLLVYRTRVDGVRRPWFYACRLHADVGHRQGHRTHGEALQSALAHCWQHAPWMRPAPPIGRYA